MCQKFQYSNFIILGRRIDNDIVDISNIHFYIPHCRMHLLGGYCSVHCIQFNTPVFRVLDSSNQTENSLPVYGESCDINEWDAPTHPEFNNTQELDLKIFRWRCCVAIGGAIIFVIEK